MIQFNVHRPTTGHHEGVSHLWLVLVRELLDFVHALADDDLEAFFPDSFAVGARDLRDDGRHLEADHVRRRLPYVGNTD